MAFADIDRVNCQIRLIYPTNQSSKKIREWEEELNNYPIVIVPQNTITVEQMRLCYVLIKQFSEGIEWYDLGYTKEYLKGVFGSIYEIGGFSLSPNKKNPLTLEQATEFIQFIIEHGIEHNISLYIRDKTTKKERHVREIVPDIQRYVIACLKQRMCCITGKIHDYENENIIDLHHVDSVASVYGSYENDDGLKARIMPLCREKHAEFHNIGEKAFFDKYHIEGVLPNEQLVYDLLEVYPNHFKLFRKRLKEGYYDNLIIKKEKK